MQCNVQGMSLRVNLRRLVPEIKSDSLSTTEETLVVEMRIWYIKIGILLV
jgi:hypothetical protein